MNVEKIRAEFEGWVVTQGSSVKRCDPDDPNKIIYMYIETQAMWLAWHASRAAMIIDLPEKMPNEDAGEDADTWFNRAIDECRESIHAAGAKTK